MALYYLVVVDRVLLYFVEWTDYFEGGVKFFVFRDGFADDGMVFLVGGDNVTY